MKRILLVFLAFIQFVNAYTQSVGKWQGDLGAYKFKADGTMTVDTIVDDKTSASVFADLSLADSIHSWQFSVNLGVNTSNDNMMRVFVRSADADLATGLDISIGTTNDNICFETYLNGASAKHIVGDTKTLDKPSSSFFVCLEQYYTSDSTLYVLYSNASGTLKSEGIAKFKNGMEGNYMGIRTSFTKTNSSGKFSISNIGINNEVGDSIVALRPLTVIQAFTKNKENTSTPSTDANGKTSLWQGMTSDYFFDDDEIATLNSVSLTSPAAIYTSLPDDEITSWQFSSKIGANTSDNNMMIVTLASDDITLSNGLAVRLGTANDNVSLFANSRTIINGRQKTLDKSNSEVFARVERYATTDSVLYVLYSNASGNMQCEGSYSILKANETEMKYCGLQTKFTKTNANNIFTLTPIDINVNATEEISVLRPTSRIETFLNPSVSPIKPDPITPINPEDEVIIHYGQNGIWHGMTPDYLFAGDGSLTLESQNLVSPSIVYANESDTAKSWQFTATLRLNPSSSNMMSIAVASEDTTLANAVIVNLGTTNDNITISIDSKIKLKTTPKTLDKSSCQVFVRVERYAAIDSTMYVLYTDASGKMQYEGSAIIACDEEPQLNYYGLQTTFSKANTSGKYTLSAIDINTIAADSIARLRPDSLISAFLEPQTPSPYRGSIVINEIMPAPSDKLGLPNVEYVELYNASNSAINLENWSLVVDDKSANGKMSYFSLPAGEYVIVCAANKRSDFAAYANVCTVNSWASLTNDGGRMVLYDCNDVVVDYIDYSKAMFDGSFKADGGWAIERVDATNLSAQSDNWCASNDKKGGTPGFANSVEAVNEDAEEPRIISAFVDDNGKMLKIIFSEPMDTTSFKSTFDISGVQMAIENVEVDPITLASFTFYLNEPLMPHRTYELLNPQANDLAGNELQKYNTRLGIIEPMEMGDLIINEIMVSAKPSSADYIEIFNKSNHNIDLSSVCIAIIVDEQIKTLLPISQLPRIAFPGDYVVATGDSLAVVEQYNPAHPEWVVDVAKMSNLAEEGTIAICDLSGDIYDMLVYSDKMHSALLNSTTNVALERILTAANTADISNWTSAAESVGFASPTAPNSQNRDIAEALASTIEIVNKVFTPDADGIDDEVYVRCNFGDGEWYTTMRIYSANGHLIATPYNNQPMPVTCELKWTGQDNDGSIMAPGTYIIYLSVWNENGNTKEFKKTCTISVTTK